MALDAVITPEIKVAHRALRVAKLKRDVLRHIEEELSHVEEATLHNFYKMKCKEAVHTLFEMLRAQ